jgi:hypothetical protein
MEIIIYKINPVSRLFIKVRAYFNNLLNVPYRVQINKVNNGKVITAIKYYKDKQIISVL